MGPRQSQTSPHYSLVPEPCRVDIITLGILELKYWAGATHTPCGLGGKTAGRNHPETPTGRNSYRNCENKDFRTCRAFSTVLTALFQACADSQFVPTLSIPQSVLHTPLYHVSVTIHFQHPHSLPENKS